MKQRVSIVYFCEAHAYVPMQELFLAEEFAAAGAQVRVVPVVNGESLPALAARLQGDLVVFWQERMTVCARLWARAAELAGMLKRKPLLGGVFATIFSEDVLREEPVYRGVITGFDLKTIAARVLAEENTPSLDAPGGIDMNAYALNLDLLDDTHKFHGAMHGYYTSQSCPNRCTYCMLPLRKKFGLAYQLRGIDLVRDDIDRMQRQLAATHVSFKDPNFFARADALDILEHCRVRGLGVAKNIDIELNQITEPLIAALQQRFGVRSLFFGLESFDQRVLSEEFLKPSRIRHLYEILRWIDRYEVDYSGIVLFGFPWQTDETIKDDLRQAFAIMRRSRRMSIYFAPYFPIPGTQMFQRHYADKLAGYTLRQKISLFNPAPENFRHFAFASSFSIDFNRLLRAMAGYNTVRTQRQHHLRNPLTRGLCDATLQTYETSLLADNYRVSESLNRMVEFGKSRAFQRIAPVLR